MQHQRQSGVVKKWNAGEIICCFLHLWQDGIEGEIGGGEVVQGG